MNFSDPKELLSQRFGRHLSRKERAISTKTAHSETIWDFLKGDVLENYLLKNKPLVEHPDFTNEIDPRIYKIGAGKSLPIRVLKHPNTSTFFKEHLLKKSNLEPLRFRFNEPAQSGEARSTDSILFLTFKQRRKKVKLRIRKGIRVVRDMDLRKYKEVIPKYSVNPFMDQGGVLRRGFKEPVRKYRQS
jgi:hypothetical protein